MVLARGDYDYREGEKERETLFYVRKNILIDDLGFPNIGNFHYTKCNVNNIRLEYSIKFFRIFEYAIFSFAFRCCESNACEKSFWFIFIIGKSIIVYRFFFKKQQREIFNKIDNKVILFYHSNNSILLYERDTRSALLVAIINVGRAF